MHSPMNYGARREPLLRQPTQLEVVAIWIGALLLVAGFWCAVALVAERWLR